MSRTIRTALLAGAVAALGAAPALAQVEDPMTFTTTFPFVVGHKTLPAGKYELSPVSDERGAYRLSAKSGKPSVYFLTEDIQGPAPHKSEVTFDRQGNRYILRSMREEGESEGEMVPAAK
jgi:hypothetical protein